MKSGYIHFLFILAMSLLPYLNLTASENSFPTIVCNESVNISVDGNCNALITPDVILEAVEFPDNEYTILIEDEFGNDISNPIGVNYLQTVVTITITHDPSGNSCWGTALIEDKLAPTVQCSDDIIECYEDPNTAVSPIAMDNCSTGLLPILIDELIDESDLCNGVTIARTYMAIDDFGNQSEPCVQNISLNIPPDVDFPSNATVDCFDYENNPVLIEPAFTGEPDVAIGVYCPFTTSYSDFTVPTCGNSFKVVRSWTVLNWCTGQVFTVDAQGDTNIQIIEVLDNTPPVISMDPFVVDINIAGVHPDPCRAQNYIPPASVSDNCNNWTTQIFTPIGEVDYFNPDGSQGGLIPSPGLEIGDHVITYISTDDCGNISELEVTITVADNTTPTAVCDEITEAVLSSDGLATVFATTFDDGSHDNCCLDFFEVKRMTDPDTSFDQSVEFNCDDVGEEAVMVVFRAYDCYGNYNDCMVEVNVEDKIPAVINNCPTDLTIDCDFYVDELKSSIEANDFSVLVQFGVPSFHDNCQFAFAGISVTPNINTCNEGNIIRSWSIDDVAGNGVVTCTQTITVEHISDWVVEFPADITITCTESLPDSGEPEMFFETCELIAFSFVDTQFDVVQDACFKIVRDWTVINWCAVGASIDDSLIEDPESILNSDCNGDMLLNDRTFQDGLNLANFDINAPLRGAQPDGVIKYQQVIKVIDDTAPVLTCPPITDLEYCIFDNSCTTSILLPEPQVADCSESLTITAESGLGSGLGPFDNVSQGIYAVTYSVSDNCGNSNACQVNIIVEDCKNPTPYCLNGLIIELDENGEGETWAVDFDAGSFDNCPGALEFSFSSNTSDNVLPLNCFNLGLSTFVEMWVTDAAGNQSFCETFLIVQDNMQSCQGDPLVSGTIENEEGETVKDVEVNINGGLDGSVTTGSDGMYLFEDLPNGGDYTVTPVKDFNHINGVTTFDLVLISKHILGTQFLDSPYKIIAADANKSNSVTTIDLVLIRRLILLINDNFPGNTSWRFVPKDFQFPDEGDPFATSFPEGVDFNNLMDQVWDADFTAIKVGDVNGSSNAQNLLGFDDRNKPKSTILMAQNISFERGDLIEVPFSFNDAQLSGYQFALDFDMNTLEFIEVKSSQIELSNFGFSKIEEGIITTSWNGEMESSKDIFSITFKAKNTGEIRNSIFINSEIMPVEAYSENLNVLDIELGFIEDQLTSIFAKAFPNPFNESTLIEFNLETEENGTIEIYASDGSLVFNQNQYFNSGSNQVKIDKLDIGESGVYFYTIKTGRMVIEGKLILL